ncbi:MAG: C69 family dipeptidase [Anaerolineales bacterium]
MCDTLIADSTITAAGRTLLAKNSDRPPNEAQFLDWIPERSYQPGEILRCTYLEIPQVARTWAVLLSRPFWMWGAEMGVNQHGLAIGNEAVFSKIPANKEPALLGMDLLRLGLERAASAPEAVDVIGSLLEQFGQGGNCVHQGHLYYHNSFLIADPQESWVLETIDRHWAARRVDPLYSISNLLSLQDSWDRSSPGLVDYIIDRGLAKSEKDIRLAGDLSDLIYTTFADGRKRCARSRALMEASRGSISPETMAKILRDHGGDENPLPGLAGADICMHASLGPIRSSQTTASLIVSLEEGNPLILATGTAAPCTGIFKPVWVDAPLDLGPEPRDTFDPATLFWAHERLHREVLANYPQRAAAFQEERDVLETKFIQGALERRGASREERSDYSRSCFQQAREAEERWLEEVRRLPVKASLFHGIAWRKFNMAAGSR